jgi:hypothetical protein
MTVATPTDLSTSSCRQRANMATVAAMMLALVALLVDSLGYVAQGVAGIVLGTVAYGLAVAYAARYDRSVRRERRSPVVSPEVWAPMSAAEARAALRRLAHTRVRRNRKVGVK